MRRRWKIAAGVWLAGALLTGAAGAAGTDLSGLRVMDKVYAAPQESGEAVASPEATEDTAIVNDGSYQGRLDAAEQKQQKLKEEKKALEKKLDNIQDFTDDVSKYVSTLDMQMTNLLDNIDANKEDIEDIKEEIQSVNEEYDNALSRQQEQYDGMKAHIKYMYENSDSNYLVYLMKSRTLAEFLSREEYVEKVTNYDKVLLNKYQQVLDEVTIARQKAEEKQREVTATKNSLKYEKEKLEQLSDEKTRQISSLLDKKEEVLSMGCGSGIMELQLENKVVAIDDNKVSIHDATENAKRLELDNKLFIAGHVNDQAAHHLKNHRYDALIINETVDGMTEDLLKSITLSGIKHLIIVSDNMSTLAKTLHQLEEMYDVNTIISLDKEPHTPRLEIIVDLKRK